MTFLISSIVFTVSCAQSFIIAAYTYFHEEPDTKWINLGNMIAAFTYLMAYVIYVVAEWRAKKLKPVYDEERLQLLINQPPR